MKKSKSDLRRMTGLSLLAAIVAVLSALGNFIRIGAIPITLVLAPIIIGAAIYGVRAGAFLGGVFGIVTFVTGVLGWDGGAVMLLMSASVFWTLFTCIVKGALAGCAAGLVYKAAEKKNSLLASVLAGIACPVVNTGIFIICMLLFFKEILASWAGGKDVVTYIIFGLTGVNFLVELAVNMILASGITAIIKYGKRGKK